jgi:hypothetical protein
MERLKNFLNENRVNYYYYYRIFLIIKNINNQKKMIV